MSTESQITPEYIALAASIVADLWAAQLIKPFNKDNGDNNALLFMLSASNTMNAQDAITEEKLEAFKQSIVEQITQAYEKDPNCYIQSIYTDYNPDQLLSNACQAADIKDLALPWKSGTKIYITRNKIAYHFGYSDPWKKMPITQPELFQSDAEYESALERIQELMKLEEYSLEQDIELDNLTFKVEAWEKIHYPVGKV